ncbi:MAG: hypothetical protein R3F14_09740 [Polyangiaceae bacterium]
MTKGKVVLGGLIDDESIFAAMKSNEDDTNRAYERAVQTEGVPERILTVFEKNLADERKHREWLEQRVATMKAKHAHP